MSSPVLLAVLFAVCYLQCVNESPLSLAESMSLFCSTPFLTSYKADAMMTQVRDKKEKKEMRIY